MTEQEFDTVIDEVANEVVENPNNGLCVTIYKKIGWNAAELFEQHFYPVDEIAVELFKCCFHSETEIERFKTKSVYWLSDDHIVNQNDNMDQVERRLLFLYSFKSFCKLRKSWKKILF